MLFTWTLAACTIRLPEPALLGVVPDRGWNGEDTVVAIEGEGLFPQVEVNLNRAGQTDLDRGYVARLDGAAGRFVLTSVSAVDYQHLRAVVDPDLPPGLYDLVVEGPTGRVARLDDAYTVTSTRADRLQLTTQILATVNTPVPVTVELFDPAGDLALEDLAVRVTFEGILPGAFNGTIGLGLGDQVSSADGQITGWLGADGRAVIPLTVHRPDTVSIRVEPLDSTSVIRSDTLSQAWRPGSDLRVAINRSDPSVVPRVGQPVALDLRLEDQFGNLVTDTSTNVTLQMACGADIASVLLSGEQQATIRPTVATDFNNPCTEQFVRVVSGPTGQSASFSVQAGDPARLDVQNTFLQYRAGSPVFAVVSTRDAFGNRTLQPGEIVLTDTVDGLGPTTCGFFTNGDRQCSAMTTVAGTGIVTSATAAGVTGTSEPYDVLPSQVVSDVVVELISPSVRAGDLVEIAAAPLDAFGNLLRPEDLHELEALVDLPGEGCVPGAQLADGRFGFECTFEAVRPDATVTVIASGVSGELEIPVVNGDAAQVVFGVPGSVEAGEVFAVDVSVFDRFMNPYVVSTSPVLELHDETGSVNEPLLLTDGEVTVTVAVTQAGINRFDVRDATGSIGTSQPLTVLSGPAESLEIHLGAAWAFVGDPTDIRIEAVDGYGNRAVANDPVTLSGPLGPPSTATLTSGVAVLSYTWDNPGLSTFLAATSGGLTGVLSQFDVVADCGTDGPVAVASFAGAPTGRACTDPTGDPVSLSMSLAGSTTGLAPLTAFRATVGGARFVSEVPTFPVEVAEAGREEVSVLVVDSALCGDAVSTTVWAGPDDGSPVGELQLIGFTNAAIGGQVDLTVAGATDCTGDPASGANIRVRTDRGELLGVSPTGQGLELELDAFGDGAFVLDLNGTRTGGPTTVRLSSDSGGSHGQHLVDVSGDDRAPEVWEVIRLVSTSPLIDGVQLVFSEPLLGSTALPTNFAVTSPAISAFSVSTPAPSVVQLAFSPAVDPASNIVELSVTSDVRDLAGNRVDGGWVGGPSPYASSFGGPPSVVDGVDCVADTTRFRPDGDPGLGQEQDRVTLTLESLSQPAFWVASVRNEDGELVRRQRLVPVGVQDSWSWDGRAADEAVQPDGNYTIDVRADDGLGNSTGGCLVPITVDNERVAP